MRVALRALACALLAGAAACAFAQTPPVDFRSQLASARLGTGYAQMINMSATDDLSAASYRIDGLDPKADIDLIHVPYQAKWLTLSPEADLDWRVGAGWLQFKQDFPIDVGSQTGGIGAKWSAYSMSGGLALKYRFGDGFVLEPALDVGLARLTSRASYAGAANLLQPVFDGLLFNWNANAWLVTPSVALEWSAPVADGRAKLRGHVARSWIGSFDETDPVQHFNEAANIYSVRGEYSRPTSWTVMERGVNWVAFAGYAGFFGANRDVFGFDGVADVGGGLEVPLAADRPRGERLRFSGAYLVGSGVHGWTVGLSLEY